MKYTTKPLNVDAIQWTAKNTADVVAFLKEHKFLNTRLERRPDTPFFVKTPKGELVVYKDQFIVIHEDGNITAHSEQYFRGTYDPAQ